jgi:hypothetical protein
MSQRTPIRWCYSKDDKHVYRDDGIVHIQLVDGQAVDPNPPTFKIIKGADPQTFEILETIWARDDSHVYHFGSMLRQADPKTFAVLNHIFAKDANHV